MKQHLHLYQWLLCLLLLVSGNVMAGKVMNLDDLEAGCVIQIYPHGYGEQQSYALACNGDGKELTSFEKAQSGYNWTIVDAGDGYIYLKNELGCYWAYQGADSESYMSCTTDISSAVKVKLTWDNKYEGVCFWNLKDGKGLNNLNCYNYKYNWYSSSSYYDWDSNTTFDVYTENCDSYETVTVDGFKYLLNLTKKSAKVIANNYEGDIVVPQYVNYENTDYAITSADYSAFRNCTSIDARYCGGNIEASAFYLCSNLTSVILGNVESIGANAFWGCDNLRSFTIPSTLKYLGSDAFNRWCPVIIKCYVENPDDIKVDDDFSIGCKRFYVLKSSLEDYKNTKPWSDMSNRIYPMGDIPITKITLPETAYIKDKGAEGKIQLLPTIEPEDADIKTLEWSSNDTNIAKVDQDGNVTGVNYGDAVITATALDGSEVSVSCKVTVGTQKVESLSFEGIPSELIVGEYVENVTSKVKVHPENADYTSIKIESSDAKILRYYNTDKLLAKQPGTATVTATATMPDGSTVSASCDITVKADPAGIDQVASDAVSVHVNGNVLSISGLASNVPISVSSVQGYLVYQGTEHTCTLPGAGIYIVKAKGKEMKVAVK